MKNRKRTIQSIWKRLTDAQRGCIVSWLRTTPGMWPETVQAYRQAISVCPDPFLPRDFMPFIPRERWHPQRR